VGKYGFLIDKSFEFVLIGSNIKQDIEGSFMLKENEGRTKK